MNSKLKALHELCTNIQESKWPPPFECSSSLSFLLEMEAYEAYTLLAMHCLETAYVPPIISDLLCLYHDRYLPSGRAALIIGMALTKHHVPFLEFSRSLLSLPISLDEKARGALIEDLLDVLPKEEKIPAFHFLLIHYAKRDKSLPKLMRALDRLLKIAPGDLEGLRSAKNLAIEKREWDEALVVLQKIASSSPNSLEVSRAYMQMVGIYLLELASPAKALAILEAHREIEETFDTTELWCMTYEALGDEDKVRQTLEARLSKERDIERLGEIKFSLAKILLRKGEYEQGLKKLYEALKAVKGPAVDIRTEIVLAHLALLDQNAASRELKNMVSLFTGDTHRAKARALAQKLEALC